MKCVEVDTCTNKFSLVGLLSTIQPQVFCQLDRKRVQVHGWYNCSQVLKYPFKQLMLYTAGQVLHAVQQELFWVESIAAEIRLSRKGGNCNSLLQSSSCFAAFEQSGSCRKNRGIKSRSRCDMWHDVAGALLDSCFTLGNSIAQFEWLVPGSPPRRSHPVRLSRSWRASSSDVIILLPLWNIQYCISSLSFMVFGAFQFLILLAYDSCTFSKSKIVAELISISSHQIRPYLNPLLWAVQLRSLALSNPLQSTSVGRPLWRSQKFLKQTLHPKGPSWDEFSSLICHFDPLCAWQVAEILVHDICSQDLQLFGGGNLETRLISMIYSTWPSDNLMNYLKAASYTAQSQDLLVRC